MENANIMSDGRHSVNWFAHTLTARGLGLDAQTHQITTIHARDSLNAEQLYGFNGAEGIDWLGHNDDGEKLVYVELWRNDFDVFTPDIAELRRVNLEEAASFANNPATDVEFTVMFEDGSFEIVTDRAGILEAIIEGLGTGHLWFSINVRVPEETL